MLVSIRVSLGARDIDWRHTSVAEIPGYPTRKLLLGFPSTLTKAAIVGPLRGLARFAEPCRQYGYVFRFSAPELLSYELCLCRSSGRLNGQVRLMVAACVGASASWGCLPGRTAEVTCVED